MQKRTTTKSLDLLYVIYPYKDVDEAIEKENSLLFSFQNSVFTENIDIALRCYSRFYAATVMVNDHTAFRVDWMPFSEAKVSGLDTGHIPYTLREIQVEKQLVLRHLPRHGSLIDKGSNCSPLVCIKST